MKTLYSIIFGVAVLGAIAWFWFVNNPSNPIRHITEPLYLQNVNYEYQKGFFALYKTTHADVVMFGDSHTFGINWNEALARQGIINRGIRGDITGGFLQRLDDVVKLHPKLCLIMGGINDLYSNVPVETIVKNYIQIIEELRKTNITVVMQATIYVAAERESSKEKNAEVTILNNKLHAYALRENILFIDINPYVCDNGYLNPEFTVDGLHLNAGGYALWLPEVEKALKSNGL